jgi:hypothetical protein
MPASRLEAIEPIDARERPGADRHVSVESEDVEHAAKVRVQVQLRVVT